MPFFISTPPTGPTAPTGRSTRARVLSLLAVIVGLHVVAFGLLLAFVVPAQLHVGAQVFGFGFGLGVTAYVYGLRHAFDPDHIAAIDNTTRKLIADGQRPVSVGFWFAMGHSSVVAVMAILVAVGAKLVTSLLSDGSAARENLGLVSTITSGGFLWSGSPASSSPPAATPSTRPASSSSSPPAACSPGSCAR